MTAATEPTRPLDRARRARVEPYFFLVFEGGRLTAGGVRISLAGVRRLQLGRAEARTLARSTGGEVTLTVPDARMSAEHARVVPQGASFHVEDAGSTNGTIVNGEALLAGASRALVEGDVLELGQTVFVYREIASEGATPPDYATDATDVPPGLATLDPELARRLGLLARVAASPLSILLLGETGTGKEVLARAMHERSRRPGPFVAVNCGAIPPNLVESHLFGHVRGSFSGAVRDEVGMVRAAQFGTLLLDEIGDLPASSQAALLRVLQEREVVPVGSAHTVKVDVRIIAATHMPLETLIEKGTFRRDLYARLAGYVFSLVPLRERRVDLGLLTASMLASGTLSLPPGLRIHREALRTMLRYDWPMNVRELAQCLGAAGALADEGMVTAFDLPAALRHDVEPRDEAPLDHEDEAIRTELLARLAEANGNVSEVARAMGKARQQIQRWTRRFGIEPERFRR